MLIDSYIYFAWLSEKLGIGSAASKKLYDFFGDAKKIYECTDYSFLKLTDKQKNKLIEKDLTSAKRSVMSAINMGFGIWTYEDQEYPQSLKLLSNPPMLLYYKGKKIDFNKHLFIGLVGTRYPTANSIQATSEITYNLVKNGIITVSGLALGIDAETHFTTLRSNGFTIGISGVKAGQIYPREHSALYSKMYENGLVICEHSPTDTVEKNSFPLRNRIISAISSGVVVMEAPQKSGALITADKAFQLKKPVFVFPGDYTSNEGGIGLLNKGAFPIKNCSDIISRFSDVEYSKFINEANSSISYYIPHAENKPKETKQNFQREEKSFLAIPQGLSKDEEEIYKYINDNKTPSTDQIIKALNLKANYAAASLSMLEIYGYINRLPGDKWSIL